MGIPRYGMCQLVNPPPRAGGLTRISSDRRALLCAMIDTLWAKRLEPKKPYWRCVREVLFERGITEWQFIAMTDEERVALRSSVETEVEMRWYSKDSA